MSTKLTDMPSKLATADAFTGKNVVDRKGTKFGKVKHIHINQDTLRVSGVTIHHGFRKDYFLPDTFIDRFTQETLLLSTPPVRESVLVVDIDGHKLGKVKKLHNNPSTGKLESIAISDGLLSSKIVSKSEIWGIGEKIILKLTKDDFNKIN